MRTYDEAAKKGPRYLSLSLSLTHTHTHTLTHTNTHTPAHRSGEYSYPHGTTAVLETSVRRFQVTSETVTRVESMET